MSHRPRVVLQAPVAGSLEWQSFDSPIEILQATTLDQVIPTLRLAEAAAVEGRYAAGFVSYEAAPAFDSALQVKEATALPLAWFGVFEDTKILHRLPEASQPLSGSEWQPTLSAAEYAERIEEIHRHIALGDTYQVNFTLRLLSEFNGDPWSLFESMCRGQRSRCCAFVDTGAWAICSASPELFFGLEDQRIWSRPMKGTARRGRYSEEDAYQARWLEGSAKNRAENVMIVDMVRNDLGRIARPDSVEVSQLWKLETYPSLFQMTSTVEARTQAPLDEIFAALFPCASVTGAPKVRSMEIIRNLEDGPRGVYTGAMGLIGPGRRARFNVGIRTAVVDRENRRAEYGTGSGVVWDSRAPDEWQECRTKALVLQVPPPEFELLETMLWEPGKGILLRRRHESRLADSAAYFNRPCDLQRVRETLDKVIGGLPPVPHRLRLLLDARGTARVECLPFSVENRPWRVAVAKEPVEATDRFLFHKTTHRHLYQKHRESFPDHDDVLLWNEQGEITESTLANVVASRGHEMVTPRLDSGLLPGTFRSELLEKEEITEGTLRLEEISQFETIFLINSVRQWIEVDLDPETLAKSH